VSPQALFGIGVLFSFAAWGIAVRRYVWPLLRTRHRNDALRPILLFHSFRFVGLAFLIPGVVSPNLPAAFARPAAYGDFATAVLALIAGATLHTRFGVVLVWAFNLLGTVDLLNAFYDGNLTGLGLDPGLQGAAYFIPTLLVPLLLITHGLVFRLLLRSETVAKSHRARRAA
jgi:hypothetical protein